MFLQMFTKITIFIYCGLFCALQSCSASQEPLPTIDEKYAAAVVTESLQVQGAVMSQKLDGGLSEAKVFLVADNVRPYVVRFSKYKLQKNREAENYNSKIAADQGYGPRIYCADPSMGFVIMEYLPGTIITEQDLKSDHFYVSLASLLRKIHQGKCFKDNGFDLFKSIENYLETYMAKYGNYIPLARVEKIVGIIHQALLPHLTRAPCHNDLHCNNLIFFNNEFKAIDYDHAGPGDPYYDIAKVAWRFSCDSVHENLLLATYLGRMPDAIEHAKLYLMKQMAAVRAAKAIFNYLYKVSPECLYQYIEVETVSSSDLANFLLKFNLAGISKANVLALLKTLHNQIFDNFESVQFINALHLMQYFELDMPVIERPTAWPAV